MRIEVTADNSNFGANATIDFGPGVTVSSVAVASPTALFADIVIANTAAPGLHDVVVHGGGDTLTLDAAFEVESPIQVEFKGTLAQASLSAFTIRNLDFASPFDDTCTAPSLFGCGEYGNVNLESPPGTTAVIESVGPYALSGTLYLDLDATSGPFNVSSGDPAGTVTVSPLGAELAVTARTALALAGTANGTLEGANGTQLYTVDAAANSVTRINVTGASGAYILGDSGSWSDLVTAGAKPNAITQTAAKYYVVVADASGDVGVSYTVAANPLALTAEVEADTAGANDTKNAAQDVAASALVTSASLSADTDVDWYRVTVPVGSTTKKVHVITAAGDPSTDTAVIIYGADGTTSLLATSMPNNPVDRDYHESVVSANVGTNASVYVKILPSDYFDVAQKNYILAIWLE